MIDEIRIKIRDELFELSVHALTRSTQRYIPLDEIMEAVIAGEVIENYPNDRYGPSCLILGYTQNQRPLHIQCSHPSRTVLKNYYRIRTNARQMGAEPENQETVIWPDEPLIETRVRYILDLDGKLFVFENVPARVNSITGEQFFSPSTVRQIQQIALSAKPPAQTIQVGLYEWGTQPDDDICSPTQNTPKAAG